MTTTIKLPELGENVDSGDLTKILVSVGDTVSKDQALLELETDKATIEVPSPVSGVIKELHVQEGRKVKVGDPLFTVEEDETAAKQKEKPQPQAADADREAPPRPEPKSKERAAPAAGRAAGTATERATLSRTQAKESVPQRKPLDREEPQPPVKTAAKAEAKAEKPAQKEAQRTEAKPAIRVDAAEAEADTFTEGERETPEDEREETVIPFRAETAEPARQLVPASPSIRRLARELGIDINKVAGTGPEGRIDEEDVKNYAKEIISGAAGTRPADETVGLPDFAKWGQIERKPMSSVRRATAEHLAQAWHNVPQVTQFDSADVTELESLRSHFSEPGDGGGPKITVTAIALKIAAAALQTFPQFAASIDMGNRQIIYKHYLNIGVAVDTSYGLVVPVVRDVDQKSIPHLAKELSELSEKAREKKLGLEEMAGGVFTITNLGGIGGTGFSPIVNYPEVAILGISRLSVEPRPVDGSTDGSFRARKILPLSLSYDHRLIDGADAARFLRWVAQALERPALLLFRA